MHVCMYICVHLRANAPACTPIYICIYIHTYVHTYIHTYVQKNPRVHTYIHTYKQTYTQTHIPGNPMYITGMSGTGSVNNLVGTSSCAQIQAPPPPPPHPPIPPRGGEATPPPPHPNQKIPPQGGTSGVNTSNSHAMLVLFNTAMRCSSCLILPCDARLFDTASMSLKTSLRTGCLFVLTLFNKQSYCAF